MNPKNIILTGLPRSGTTLSCHLLNQLPNVVALHEPMEIEKLGQVRDGATLVTAVQEFFKQTRTSILSTGAALSKHAGGVVPDNPFSNERLATGKRRSLVSHGTIQIDKPLTDDFLLVIKHPMAFTAALDRLQEHFSSHAIVRNPLAILASWNSLMIPIADGHAPAAEQLDLQLRRELARLTDKTDRQLHLLSWCFEKYGRLLPRSSVIRYEEIISTGGGALYPVSPQATQLKQPLASKNLNSLYDREGMLRLGQKLLASDGAYWDFYCRESVIALLDTVSREAGTLSGISSAPSASPSNNNDMASGNRQTLPIALVIGCARSGTSILGEAIAAHPGVKYIFEPHSVWDQAGPGENESHRLTASHASPSLIEGIRSWFAREKGGAQWLVEKTPRNALRVPFLRAVFPEAKFIHIVRDGRDVACSLLPGIGGTEWKHLKPPSWQTLQAQFTGLERCARTWQEVVEIATADLEGVPHLRVSYEQMVADPRAVMAQVLVYLGLPPDPAVDAFCQRIQDKTSGSYHARHQLDYFRDNHAHRVGRWRENGTADEQVRLQRLLQPTLGKLGYGDCRPASKPPDPTPTCTELNRRLHAHGPESADAHPLLTTPAPEVALIAGMHRSGTSMVAHLLHLCGLQLGPREELGLTDKSNRDGHWENARFLVINEAILNELGGAWDLPPSPPSDWLESEPIQKLVSNARDAVAGFGDGRTWGWKDPRNSLTLPFWKSLIPGLKVVVCLRNPLEVALSLRARGVSSYAFGLTLWKHYYRELLAHTRPAERIVTHYEAYFTDPIQEVRRVLAFLGLPASENALSQCRSTVKGDMRNHRIATPDLAELRVEPEILQLYQELCAEAGWAPTAASLPVQAQKDYKAELSVCLQKKTEASARPGAPLDHLLMDQVLAQREIGALRGQRDRNREKIHAMDQRLAKQIRTASARQDQLTHLQNEAQREIGALRGEVDRNREKIHALEQRLAEQVRTASARQDQQEQRTQEMRRGLEAQLAHRDQVISDERDQKSRLQIELKQHAEQAAQRDRYTALLLKISRTLRDRLPASARVLVVSKGDEGLLAATGCEARHFPADAGGAYRGYHPADSAEAVALLTQARQAGGEFFVLPETAFWWLECYSDFRRHLETHCPAVALEETCKIYDLRPIA